MMTITVAAGTVVAMAVGTVAAMVMAMAMIKLPEGTLI
jgi:TRAP-type mannitol/chloroaromatic compound transport system permease large subunit